MNGCTEPRYRELLGAHALGACPPNEAVGLAEHLRKCRVCGQELAKVSSGRDVLFTAVHPAAPSPATKHALMQQIRAEATLFEAARTRDAKPAPSRAATWRAKRQAGRRWALGPALALASVLAVAAIGGVLAGRALNGSETAKVVAAQVDERLAPDARASVELDADGERLVVAGLPPAGRDRVYQVWLRSEREAPRPTDALFSPGPGGSAAIELPADVRDADELLLTSEPAAGSKVPTREPVLTATL